MIKKKDEALEKFKEFKVLAEKQFGRRIKHNGIVERRNRTILNVTRSMLSAMNMLQSLWAEAVRHSFYIINQMPTKTLKDKTPYEALKERKPRMDHLRVFGCVGHVKTPIGQTKKMDNRSNPMVHLGTEPARIWEWQPYQSSEQDNEKEFIVQHSSSMTHSVEDVSSSSKDPESSDPTSSNSPQDEEKDSPHLVEHISGEEQRADILTKALPKIKFTEMRSLLGVERIKRTYTWKIMLGSRLGGDYAHLKAFYLLAVLVALYEQNDKPSSAVE
ncbi:hypothetical protein E3N88_13316 [Mikania micrantha]|uniref:Integrase catalytic domain-containing protein n=1 Tax=Mikania micrantha TaxID=192012 RepID=A0A5N6PAJ5_9ASTR|nr:hypothetical protein E3N88_13316 [Mikania micrantha]